MRDAVFAEPLAQVERFVFDERVVKVFDDMISRSVPGYRSIVTQTGLLAAHFARPNSYCYDLGSSLGAATFSMQAQLAKKPLAGSKIVAVDNSAAMVKRLQRRLAVTDPQTMAAVPIELHQADITHIALQPCSVAVLNFTLQFVEYARRDAFVQRLAERMLTGGALILSEKIAFEDSEQQQLHTRMYEQFKRSNGYSELEISQKRDALENVLIPETLERHRQRLRSAGFQSVEVWFQCYNFMSLVAIR